MTNDKSETKKPGRPRRKALKSPTKNSSDQDYCPCKEYMAGELSVECQNCDKYWHLCCVGLRGLSLEMVESLESWQCPDCYLCPHSYKEKTSPVSSSNDCGTLKVIVRDELHAIQPVIKVTVENAVRNLLSQSVCSKEDIKAVVKSYADVAKETQKEVIEQASLAQSSKNVVESVVRKMDADKVEREKRRTNVVVLSAPEPNKDSSSEEKQKEDKNFCTSVLGIPSKDIKVCWRAGKADESNPDFRRPLVIRLRDEELVKEWTKDGRGHKTESGHWINRDLCAADRKANFLSREERRRRQQKN